MKPSIGRQIVKKCLLMTCGGSIYTPKKELSQIPLNKFTAVRDRFQANGIGTGYSKPHNKGDVCRKEEKILKIKNFSDEHPKVSIRQTARELDMPQTVVYRTLRDNLDKKPYKPTIAQKLTKEHKVL